MKKQITIAKSDVYEIVEGLTVNIGQKNPDANFETLWASQGDVNSLNLFWDEAVTDLQNTLQYWTDNFTETATGYTITLKVANDWPTGLETTLKGSMEQYMAHAILAAWLSIMPAVKVNTDYTSVAADDLGNVVTMVLRRKPVATPEKRAKDEADQEDDDASIISADGRHADASMGDDDDYSIKAGARHNNRDHEPVCIQHETLNISGVYGKKY